MVRKLLDNPFFNAIRNVKNVLDPDQKRSALLMVILLIINAIFDFAGLATIGALIISALESNIFEGPNYQAIEGANRTAEFFNTSLRSLYDYSGAENQIAFLFYLSIVIFFVFLIKNAISLYIGYVQSKFAYSASFRLNKKLFKYYYDQGYLFIKDSASGKKVYSIVDIPMRFAAHYLNTLMQLGTEIVILTIIALSLLLINPIAVVLLALAILPTFYIIYSFSKNRTKEIGLKRNELAPVNYSSVMEAMNGYVDVKLGNLENEMLAKYGKIQKKLNDVDTLFFGIYQKLNQRTNDIVFGLGILVIFGYAHFFKLPTSTVLSLLGLFAIAAYKFLPSFNRVLSSLLTIKNSSFVITELQKVTGLKLSEFKKVERLTFKEHLKLNNISYKYPGGQERVLNNINLKIRKGETIGFVGISGSGKTTLLKVLLRLITETKGNIEIDGREITEELKASYQKIIGYVEQEIFILNDTILSNIAFGVENPNEEKIWDCLREAQLSSFVKNHEDQLQMKLGENGVNLSGGQKQRVGIARALYKDSEVLFFDEATSALDSETEKAVVESINHLSNLGKTIIIVAHRITTLEKCNRIFEIRNGSIHKQHDYKELLKEKILQ